MNSPTHLSLLLVLLSSLLLWAPCARLATTVAPGDALPSFLEERKPIGFSSNGASTLIRLAFLAFIVYGTMHTWLSKQIQDWLHMGQFMVFAIVFSAFTWGMVAYVNDKEEASLYAIKASQIAPEVAIFGVFLLILYVLYVMKKALASNGSRKLFPALSVPELLKPWEVTEIQEEEPVFDQFYDGGTLLHVKYVQKLPFLLRQSMWPFMLAYLLWFNWMRISGVAPDNFLKRTEWTYLVLIAILHFLTMASISSSPHMTARLCYREVFGLQDADHVIVHSSKAGVLPEICKLERFQTHTDGPTDQTMFIYHKGRYLHDALRDSFAPLAYPDGGRYYEYLNPKYQDERDKEVLYGENKIVLPVPTFVSEYFKAMVSPNFLFSALGVYYYYFMGYTSKFLFNLFTKVNFEIAIASAKVSLLKTDIKFTSHDSFKVHRKSPGGAGFEKPTDMQSDSLLPGDIVELGPYPSIDSAGTAKKSLRMSFDGVLIDGNCMMNEASLTGEMIAIPKAPIVRKLNEEDVLKLYDPSTDLGKGHTMFAGTVVLLATKDSSRLPLDSQPPWINLPEITTEAALVMVLRTGFGNTQGRMLREIIYKPLSSPEEYRPYDKYMQAIIVTSMFFAFFVAIYEILYIPGARAVERLQACLLYVFDMVPQSLNAYIETFLNGISWSLVFQYIHLSQPRVIPIAGKLDVCCFDKTGTLTREDLICTALIIDFDTVMALGTGHSLSPGFESQGDPLEYKPFRLAGFSFSDPRDVKILSKRSSSATGLRVTLRVLKKNPFNPLTKSMSVASEIIEFEGEEKSIGQLRSNFEDETQAEMVKGSYFIAMKGSPASCDEQFIPDLIPKSRDKHGKEVSRIESYYNIHDYFARQGFRIIVVGYKIVSKEDYEEASKSDAELVKFMESNVVFGGFVLFDNPLKGDTCSTIEFLAKSQHKLVMITGDGILTAISIAEKLALDPIESTTNVAQSLPGASGTGRTETAPRRSHKEQERKSEGEKDEQEEKTERGRREGIIERPRRMAPLSGNPMSLAGNRSKPYARIEFVKSTKMLKITQPVANNEEEAQVCDADAFLGLYETYMKEHQDLAFAMDFNSFHYINGKEEWRDKFTNTWLKRISVFPSFTPQGKGDVVSMFNMLGWNTLMCGDGGNDVLAWKEAHISIALTNESLTHYNDIGWLRILYYFLWPKKVEQKKTLVASITARTSSLSAVTKVITAGRQNILNMRQLFVLLFLETVIKAYCTVLSVIYELHAHEVLNTGLIMLPATVRAILALSTPEYGLYDKSYDSDIYLRPPSYVFDSYNIIVTFLQYIVYVITITLCFHMTRLQVAKMVSEGHVFNQKTSLYLTTSHVVASFIHLTMWFVNYDSAYRRKFINTNFGSIYFFIFVAYLLAILFNLVPFLTKKTDHVAVPRELAWKLLVLVIANWLAAWGLVEAYSYGRRPAMPLWKTDQEDTLRKILQTGTSPPSGDKPPGGLPDPARDTAKLPVIGGDTATPTHYEVEQEV